MNTERNCQAEMHRLHYKAQSTMVQRIIVTKQKRVFWIIWDIFCVYFSHSTEERQDREE